MIGPMWMPLTSEAMSEGRMKERGVVTPPLDAPLVWFEVALDAWLVGAEAVTDLVGVLPALPVLTITSPAPEGVELLTADVASTPPEPLAL
jgi:hypothetical protein